LFLILFFLFLGIIIGSFLNVVIYRLPEGKSIIYPPSHCPKCNKRLKMIDLIPVLSYLSTRGKCRYCKEKISFQYPFVELLTGFLFLSAYLKFGLNIKLIFMLILLSSLIVISFIDYKFMIIPNVITYPGVIIGLLYAIIFEYINIINSLLGIFIPAFLLLIIALIFRGGMGIGDIKLVAMLGAFLGYKYTLAAIFIGSVFGSIIGLTLMSLGILKKKSRIPFGPFICIGAVLMIFYGDYLISFYLSLFI